MNTQSKYATVIRSLKVFSRQDQRKIIAITIIQIFLGLIDLLGVAIFGIMGALTVTGVQSRQPSSRVGSTLKFLGIDNFTFQSQVAILALIAASALIIRTLVSVYFSRKILYFLSRKSALISANAQGSG